VTRTADHSVRRRGRDSEIPASQVRLIALSTGADTTWTHPVGLLRPYAVFTIGKRLHQASKVRTR